MGFNLGVALPIIQDDVKGACNPVHMQLALKHLKQQAKPAHEKTVSYSSDVLGV